MEEFLQQLTNGLAVGGIYALIALGYTMVYGVLKLINFAHGDLFTYGAYLGLTLLTSLALTDRLGLALGILVLVLMVMGLAAVLGAILERAAYRPLRESPRLSAVVSALGASIFLQNTLMLLYGARFQVYPDGVLPNTALDLFDLIDDRGTSIDGAGIDAGGILFISDQVLADLHTKFPRRADDQCLGIFFACVQ